MLSVAHELVVNVFLVFVSTENAIYVGRSLVSGVYVWYLFDLTEPFGFLSETYLVAKLCSNYQLIGNLILFNE